MLPGSWRKSASREGARRTGERPDRGIRGRRTCTHDARKGFRLNGHQSRPAWPRAAGTVSRDASDPEPRPLGRILGAHPAGGQGLAPTARRAARRRESRTCTHARTHTQTHIHSRAHTRTCTRTHAPHAIKETGREAATGHACLFLGCDAPRPVSSPTVASRLAGCDAAATTTQCSSPGLRPQAACAQTQQ